MKKAIVVAAVTLLGVGSVVLGTAGGAPAVAAPVSAVSQAAAQPATQASSDSNVVSHRVTQSPAEVERYWTTARMLRVAGAADSSLRYSARYSTKAAAAAAVPRGPAAVGKLFATYGKSDIACTATVVDSANESVVITAGHCINYKGKWATNVSFVPGYRTGGKLVPYGRWYPAGKATTVGYARTGNWLHDIGFLKMKPKDDQPLGRTVGMMGIAFSSQTQYQKVRMWGYSSLKKYGDRIALCVRNTLPAKGYLAIACALGSGSDGGPWIVSPNWYGYGTVVGVTSRTVPGRPGVAGSPLLANARKVYDLMAK